MTFDANGGHFGNYLTTLTRTLPKDSKTAISTPVPKSASPDLVFDHWALEDGTEIDWNSAPGHDFTLYAVWAQPDFILPPALTKIEDEAFAGGAFIYVKLPEQAVSIGRNAFADCPNLTYIYIPAQTTEIHAEAFGNIQGLTILGNAGSYAETYAQDHNYVFISVS